MTSRPAASSHDAAAEHEVIAEVPPRTVAEEWARTPATPETIAAAEARMAELWSEIVGIEQQLGDRGRVTADGRRLTGIEYFTWRNSAVGARRFKLEDYRVIKAWLKANRSKVAKPKVATLEPDDQEDPVAVLLALYRCLRAEFDGQWDTVLPETSAMMDRARDYLQSWGINPYAKAAPA